MYASLPTAESLRAENEYRHPQVHSDQVRRSHHPVRRIIEAIRHSA